jgi:putative NADH-flavin reductase
VLVFGAGGAIGSRVVREAVARRHEVTAVHRRPPVDAERDRVVAGDVRDPEPALARHDPEVVVSAVGAGPARDHRVYGDAARALVGALRTRGDRAPRLLVVGGAGSLLVGPGRRLLDTPGFPAAFRADALAQAEALAFYRTVADVRWTYVSPAAQIAPGERTGRFRIGEDELLVDDQGRSRISIEDYASALVDEIERPSAVGRRMAVAY